MTNIGEDLLKTPVGWVFQPNNETLIITSHSEDNNILSPKNLLKGLQETFLSRPLRERRNFLANVSELRNFREGYNSKINKIIRHSCIIREDLSLDAQDDENVENDELSPKFLSSPSSLRNFVLGTRRTGSHASL